MKYSSSQTKSERKAYRKRAAILIASCFCIILSAVFLMNLETPSVAGHARNNVPASLPPAGELARPALVGTANSSAAGISFGEPDLTTLASKNLLIPVEGVAASELRDSFHDARSEGRSHGALDIMAPRDTPVLATDDGVAIKLHHSSRGGTMLYQSDRSGLYVYSYAHLSRYADGMFQGKLLKRGEVIAYVGDSGNAAPGNCHLHFGISRVTAPGKWSGGEPINPYRLLTEKRDAAPITAGK